jgi:hypothetical protein
MSVLSLQTLKPRTRDHGMLENSTTSSGSNCCNNVE